MIQPRPGLAFGQQFGHVVGVRAAPVSISTEEAAGGIALLVKFSQKGEKSKKGTTSYLLSSIFSHSKGEVKGGRETRRKNMEGSKVQHRNRKGEGWDEVQYEFLTRRGEERENHGGTKEYSSSSELAG